MYEKLEQFFRARRAEYEFVPLQGAVTAQEQAAQAHTPGGSWAKVVIVKAPDGLVMAVLPASSVIDLDRLRGVVGRGVLELARAEEIREAVGDCPAGAIPPFGELFGLPAFLDRSLSLVAEVTMPAGDFASAVRMHAAEFRRLFTGRVTDFATPEAVVAAGGVLRAPRGRRRAR